MKEENCKFLLFEALEAGDIQTACEIVAFIRPDCRNDDGDTPLILAARNGHEELVRFLLEKG